MPRSRVPSYRHHKPSNQAVVTVRTATGERRDVYLGAYDSPEYAPVIAELAASPVADGPATNRTRAPPSMSCCSPSSSTPSNTTAGPMACGPTKSLSSRPRSSRCTRSAAHTEAASFGLLAHKAVRQKYIENQNCRTLFNSRIGKVKRVFRSAVEQQLVPITTYAALATVAGLRARRTTAREPEPVVHWADR
jgi:hypothetical protein